ncbi:hypothetical protein C8R44DRAFT_728830 [Mycena epipterygia]|nr:hypothetical protein C8R44DRAFT_728830 [Mycena epipterygia]
MTTELVESVRKTPNISNERAEHRVRVALKDAHELTRHAPARAVLPAHLHGHTGSGLSGARPSSASQDTGRGLALPCARLLLAAAFSAPGVRDNTSMALEATNTSRVFAGVAVPLAARGTAILSAGLALVPTPRPKSTNILLPLLPRHRDRRAALLALAQRRQGRRVVGLWTDYSAAPPPPAQVPPGAASRVGRRGGSRIGIGGVSRSRIGGKEGGRGGGASGVGGGGDGGEGRGRGGGGRERERERGDAGIGRRERRERGALGRDRERVPADCTASARPGREKGGKKGRKQKSKAIKEEAKKRRRNEAGKGHAFAKRAFYPGEATSAAARPPQGAAHRPKEESVRPGTAKDMRSRSRHTSRLQTRTPTPAFGPSVHPSLRVPRPLRTQTYSLRAPGIHVPVPRPLVMHSSLAPPRSYSAPSRIRVPPRPESPPPLDLPWTPCTRTYSSPLSLLAQTPLAYSLAFISTSLEMIHPQASNTILLRRPRLPNRSKGRSRTAVHETKRSPPCPSPTQIEGRGAAEDANRESKATGEARAADGKKEGRKEGNPRKNQGSPAQMTARNQARRSRTSEKPERSGENTPSSTAPHNEEAPDRNESPRDRNTIPPSEKEDTAPEKKETQRARETQRGRSSGLAQTKNSKRNETRKARLTNSLPPRGEPLVALLAVLGEPGHVDAVAAEVGEVCGVGQRIGGEGTERRDVDKGEGRREVVGREGEEQDRKEEKNTEGGTGRAERQESTWKEKGGRQGE